MTERPQRLVFGTVAEAYDAHRPSYPDALFDDLLGRVPAAPDVVDGGCGTGKVARSFADRGLPGTGVEPDADMAAIARRNLTGTGWQVVESGFEDVDLPDRCADLVTFGQAWHWVDTDRGLATAARVLRPGGVLALFWNRPTWVDLDLRAALDHIYDDLAPGMRSSIANTAIGAKGEHPDALPPELGDAAAADYSSTVVYGAQAWTDLLGTHSNHVMLAPDVRARLHDAVARAIDEHGGAMEIRYRTDCWTAVRV